MNLNDKLFKQIYLGQLEKRYSNAGCDPTETIKRYKIRMSQMLSNPKNMATEDLDQEVVKAIQKEIDKDFSCYQYDCNYFLFNDKNKNVIKDMLEFMDINYDYWDMELSSYLGNVGSEPFKAKKDIEWEKFTCDGFELKNGSLEKFKVRVAIIEIDETQADYYFMIESEY